MLIHIAVVVVILLRLSIFAIISREGFRISATSASARVTAIVVVIVIVRVIMTMSIAVVLVIIVIVVIRAPMRVCSCRIIVGVGGTVAAAATPTSDTSSARCASCIGGEAFRAGVRCAYVIDSRGTASSASGCAVRLPFPIAAAAEVLVVPIVIVIAVCVAALVASCAVQTSADIARRQSRRESSSRRETTDSDATSIGSSWRGPTTGRRVRAAAGIAICVATIKVLAVRLAGRSDCRPTQRSAAQLRIRLSVR